MEKIAEQGLLYDFYGSLLTAHQQDIYEKLVYEDQSLNEIAAQEGISKQAVHDLSRRCTAQLEEYEEKLHMIRRFHRVKAQLAELQKIPEIAENEAAMRLIGGIEDTMNDK